MKVLTINTYAGSLLLGAKASGAELVGSLEDVGYGVQIQRANWPDLPVRDERKDWPEALDLSETIVLAHPPCSAFSRINNSEAKRGVDAPAFQCTRQVLDYAMENKAVAIAVESVTGALQGAWDVHEQYAAKHGYHVYRVLQNGAMFSAQYRNRFWALFVRKGASPHGEDLVLRLTPRWQTVQDAIEGHEGGPVPEVCEGFLRRLKIKLVGTANLSDEQLARLFDAQVPPHVGTVDRVAQKLFWKDQDLEEVRGYMKDAPHMWVSAYLRFLDPRGIAGTLLGNSWWYVNGRNLSMTGYNRLMGFPGDYVFPTEKSIYRNHRTFLSKGVIPAVASWVYEQLETALGARAADAEAPLQVSVKPGGIADFRFRRQDWGAEKPSLAHEDVLEEGDEETGENGEPLEKKPRAARGTRPAKRRVEQAFFLTVGKALPEDALREAFMPRKELLVFPLKEHVYRNDERTQVEVVVQYEPPKAGGIKADVERIVARALVALEAWGYGPATSAEEGFPVLASRGCDVDGGDA